MYDSLSPNIILPYIFFDVLLVNTSGETEIIGLLIKY